MYKLIRPFLFKLSPEKAHHFTFSSLKIIFKIPLVAGLIRSYYKVNNPSLKRNLFGLTFDNPVGLAAGLDKDATLFDELSCFGFGFIEIGTITPKGQPGNEKPRMFRLRKDKGILNRMGFNNGGADAAAIRLKKRKTNIIIGGNIGKNKATPNENAINDYAYCFNALYDVVDYFVVNVSSPNTPNLRELQDKEPLTKLLNYIMKLNHEKLKPKPVLLKIAPDLSNEQLDDIITIVKETKIDGVIATNTTIDNNVLNYDKEYRANLGLGGISGKPLTHRSTEVIKYLVTKSNNSFPVIGVGGIHDAKDALEKLHAGASLIQIYTGFIYEGPGIVKKICKAIVKDNQQ